MKKVIQICVYFILITSLFFCRKEQENVSLVVQNQTNDTSKTNLISIDTTKSIIGKNIPLIESPFFEFPSQKMWRHRVNCIGDAIDYSRKFPGLETDIYFDPNHNDFYCTHGEPCSFIDLRELLDTVDQTKTLYYWLDFKNTDINDIVDSSVIYLDKLLTEYKIKDKCIVETKNPYCLKIYSEHGFFTSYWVPEFYPYTEENRRDSIISVIDSVINLYKPTVISAEHQMYEILVENFPNQMFHFWTNGLYTEEDKKRIKLIEDFKNTKVILIDYEEPF